ncbi:MAG: Flp family type IVb pilin [Gemmatimonadaceae bacterium]
MEKMQKMVAAFIREDDGATMIEYALLVALIAVVVAVGLVTLGTAIRTKYSSVSDCIKTPATACT